MTTIIISLNNYPLFANLPNPKGTILAILDQQHAIFTAQQSSQGNIELLNVVTKTCEELRETTEEGIERIDNALNKIPTLLGNSSKKGIIAELDFNKFIYQSLDKIEYNIENVSKTKHSGDVIISKGEFQCMCDTKNYSTTVPSKEVNKLKNDMITRNIRCGLLVSYESGIAKHKNIDMIFFKNIENQLNCLFILGNAKECPDKIVIAIYYLEAVWNSILNSSVSHNIGLDTYEDILGSVDTLMGLIQNYTTHKRQIEDNLITFNTFLIETVTMHISLLKTRLKK